MEYLNIINLKKKYPGAIFKVICGKVAVKTLCGYTLVKNASRFLNIKTK